MSRRYCSFSLRPSFLEHSENYCKEAEMNRVSALVTIAPKTCVRRLSVAQIRCNKFDLSKIKKKQLQYQENNDVPVYIKGGPMDHVLYYSTLALLLFGVSASLHSAYMLANKK